MCAFKTCDYIGIKSEMEQNVYLAVLLLRKYIKEEERQEQYTHDCYLCSSNMIGQAADKDILNVPYGKCNTAS